MIDGLYFWDKWVADVDISVTKQANDLTNPAQLQSSYANLFTLPDTTDLRRLLQNAEQIDAGGRDPYRLIPAKLIDEGEVVFSGNATLLSFQGGWKVSLAASMKGLFDQLADIRLSDLELSRYDHPWTIETIAGFAQNTDGIVYPAIDYGGLSAGAFAQDTLTPGMFAKTLISTMLQRYGYKTTGEWTSDLLYNRIVLPFVDAEPKAHDDDWRIARQARVTVTGVRSIEAHNSFNVIVEYNRDNEKLSNWIDGSANNFKAETFRYVCDVPMRLRVHAYQRFKLKVSIGAVECFLIVEKNGQNVAEIREEFGAPFNLLMQRPTTLSLDEVIECRAGDQIQIRLIVQKQTAICTYFVEGAMQEEDTWASFEPETTLSPGDTWPVAQNLPDMSCMDLLKTVALKCCGTFEVDDVAKTIRLRTLDGVIANEANATDLSTCVEESGEPENAVAIPPYGQKNLLKWKELDNKILKGYGDGVISCDAQNIPLETTLFELPFTAVVDSKTTIAGYGNPPFIETRLISGSGDTIRVEKKAALPCLMLVEPTKPVTVTVNVVTPELTVRPTEIPLTSCWWYTRPIGLSTSDNAFSLAFDRPAGATTAEQTLIIRYFGALRRVLRRPRLFSPPAYLRPATFATLDLYAPVRLRAVRAGSLNLNDNYYYINKVSNYQSGKPCSLTLIPY